MSDNQLNVIIPEVLEQHAPAQNPGFGQQDTEEELTHLQVLIEAEEWDDALKRMTSKPEEIMGSKSVTALHLALEGGECPFPILRTMIEMEPMLPSKTDKNGNTPLHIACAGEFAYDPLVIATLLIAYPQAVLMKDKVEKTTPLHMLLCIGGDVNITCLKLLLDVAYSSVAGLPENYVLAVEFLSSPIETSVAIAQHYPPLATRVAREMATSDPYGFPAFLRPFLHLPVPESLDSPPQLMEQQRKLLLVRDGMKQVPLHIAARARLSKEVVEVLLQEEHYPGAHKAAHLRERKDRYPLHYCGMYAGPIGAAACIFEANKDAISYHEQYGMIPYQGSANGLEYTLEERRMKTRRTRQDPSDSMEGIFELRKSLYQYLNMKFFLGLTYKGSEVGDDFSVVHAASAVPSPADFLRASIMLHPWQVTAGDEDGNLPLHLACKVLRPHGINHGFYWMKKDIAYKQLAFRLVPEDRPRDNPITILTEAYSKGASTLDNEGNLPLHSAIVSGKGMVDGIHSLVQAAPMALATRSMADRLYPFMLAAMSDDLSLTLDLLLANPMMVQGGINVYSEDKPAAKRIRES
jgi:ankyrin repeat protein